MTINPLIILELASETETCDFARHLSLFLRPGLLILLEGDLGTGKSTFARALIQTLLPENDSHDIPSPTFSIMQVFDSARIPVVHADFYRLKSEAEVEELNLDQYVNDHVLIIEWPNDPVSELGEGQLRLHFSGEKNQRRIVISSFGKWQGLLARYFEINRFFNGLRRQVTDRCYLDGDASSRRYEKLKWGDSTAILMDMPRRPDGPAIRNGKSYSSIAHLAEGIEAVIAINKHLCAQGFAAPQTYESDVKAGLAIVEDLGDDLFGKRRSNGNSMIAPMRAAIELLVEMTEMTWPASISLPNNEHLKLSRYDMESQLIEVNLLLEWYLPSVKKTKVSHPETEQFDTLWKAVLSQLPNAHEVWVLRDFHSPNLIWRPSENGLKRVGLIDTQDAVLGHSAYDLVSLLQDARIDLGPNEEQVLYEYYVNLRSQKSNFDRDEFQKTYAILGAQRATKILGIFSRLATRDSKPTYLQHIPRARRYLQENLKSPALSDLRTWFDSHLAELNAVA